MPVKLGLYVITDRDLCGARGVAETVRRVVRGGARIVQLREKKAGFDDQLRQVEELAEAIDGRARLIVNDRLDVAIAARDRGIPVDGVHLGQGDARALTSRQALGRHAIVGLTANTSAHLAAVSQLQIGRAHV